MDLFGEPDPPAVEDTQSEAEDTQAAAPETGLLPPRKNPLCFGHDRNEQALLAQFKAGRMPHGLILSGVRGIGKATFAYRLARFLLSREGGNERRWESFEIAPNDPAFERVASGGHPDLLMIERAYDATKDKYKDNVAVDEVRKVTPFLRKTASYDGGWRVVIVDDADTMNRSAQNALLKILEEPPANTVLILVCHRLGALIPTIRSRTQTLHFHSLAEHDFEALLHKQGAAADPTQLETLYHMAEGSAGLALEILEQGGLDTLSDILNLFETCPKWQWADIHALSEQLARNGRDQNYKSFSALLPWVFSQMITAKARGQNLARILESEALINFYRQSSLETLLKICENLKSHFERVDRANLDKRQAVLGAFSIIAA